MLLKIFGNIVLLQTSIVLRTIHTRPVQLVNKAPAVSGIERPVTRSPRRNVGHFRIKSTDRKASYWWLIVIQKAHRASFLGVVAFVNVGQFGVTLPLKK